MAATPATSGAETGANGLLFTSSSRSHGPLQALVKFRAPSKSLSFLADNGNSGEWGRFRPLWWCGGGPEILPRAHSTGWVGWVVLGCSGGGVWAAPPREEQSVREVRERAV